MIRIVIENVLLFLLPTLAYLGWVLIARPETLERTPGGRIRPMRVLNDAPLLWLAASGTILLMVVLVAFGKTSGGRPDQTYSPPIFKDGKIQPGHIE
ncbi:MAG: hypothetical protein B7Y80_05495 [Hyphomicrobium sp. 32-62-53]|nr:MAG: hypothetical protein B7Z29_11225 [Hyphomicrobium sp. 12-62-95]OYY00699.1 MAG: hypothetical protein B7Y80_05495 [Hyphomicrobium sp. 32-62-53]